MRVSHIGQGRTALAERLELSHALLYRYVESKEASLELAVRYAMDHEAELEAAVPLATPAEGLQAFHPSPRAQCRGFE